MAMSRILVGLSIAALVPAFLLFLGWLFQRRLIYFPLRQGVPPVGEVLAGGEEVGFETEDGLKLAGWFLPAQGGGTRVCVLVFNGNAGNRAERAPLARGLSRAGLSVLLSDYRGYGGNPGRPSEVGLQADARAARAYLGARDDVDPDRIVYLGESLGAAVAVALAGERPPAALVLRSPFTSLVDVGRAHYRFLPVGALLRDRYDSMERTARLSAPLLVVAGSEDHIVPIEQSRALYQAATGPKRLVTIEGADHNDFELAVGHQLVRQVVGFIREVVQASPEEDS